MPADQAPTAASQSGAPQSDALAPRGLLHRLSGPQGLEALHGLLRAEGFAVGPDRWQNVCDLLLVRQIRGAGAADPAMLRPLLAPLFCRSEREQRRFAELFDLWRRGLQVEPTPGATSAHASGPASGPASAQPAPAPKPTTEAPGRTPAPAAVAPLPQPDWRRIGLRATLAVGLLLVLLGTALWWHQQFGESSAQERPQTLTRADRSAGGGDATTPTPRQAPRFLPPRRPLEQPRLDPGKRWLLAAAGWLLALAPLLALLPRLIRRWVGYGLVLRRRQQRAGAGPEATHRITLDAAQDDLFDGASLRAALRRLHRPLALPTRRLDGAASAVRSARRAGLFAPVYRVQRRVPDLVALVEHAGGADQLAGGAEQALDRLAAAGLNLVRYQYGGDPRRPVAADGRRLSLDALAHRHAGARLLLVGDLAGLVDPFSAEPRPWLAELDPLGRRGLLGTRGVPAPWRLALEAQGFCVAELGSAGLTRAALWLGLDGAEPLPLPADPPGPVLPAALRDAGRWRHARPDGARLAELDAALAGFLAADGRLLLAAMAAYPQLHWGLTRALDLLLFPRDEPAPREHRLLHLARLPWCRAGRLPDWLRRHLLDGLVDQDRERIAERWERLLRTARIDGIGRVRLPVDLPGTGPERLSAPQLEPQPDPHREPARRRRRAELRRWLRREQELAALPPPGRRAGDPLRDRVFAELLLGRRRDPLALPLPPVLARRLARRLGPRLAAWLRHALPWLAAAGVAGAALHAGWTQLAMPHAADLLLWRQLAPNARVQVDLWHTEQAHAEALALAETLRAWRFAVDEMEQRPLAMPETLREAAPDAAAGATRPRPVNAVQWSSDTDAAAALQVAARLTRLTWGQVPNKVPPGAELPVTGPELDAPLAEHELRVLLLTPAFAAERGGYRFRDPLRAAADGAAGAAGAPAPLAIIRDTVSDGTPGPELVALPGGTFTMGSPPGEPERYSDEGPQREVRIRPFAIGRTEVTFTEYDRFAEATGRDKPNDQGWGRGLRPVINVSWDDAQAYAAWLSEQTGAGYRLPTEAEWEYAARAGTETPFWTGACIHTDQANYDGNYDYYGCGAETGVYRAETVPAGSLPANAFGLHEVAGNVYEWVEDCWHDSYDGAPTDGSAWLGADDGECARRVLRGGAWYSFPRFLRAAARDWDDRVDRVSGVGFRLARTR